MSLFNQFEQQYSTITAEVTAKIGRLQLLAPGERREGVQNVERLLEEVQDLLDQMELAVRDLPSGGPDRSKYDLRVKSYRNDKRHLELELKKAVARLNEGAARDELLGSPSTSDGGGLLSEDQKAQLLSNTAKLEGSSRKLYDGYRVCLETEQIGADVLNNLENQRETINRSRDRMREAESDIGQSGQILSKMITRVVQNRIVLVGVMVVFVLTVVLIIYWSI